MITERNAEKLAGMLVPVVCSHCGAIYDLCAAEPTARYADCTCFKTPCCGRHADDRQWKSLPDFTRLGSRTLGLGRVLVTVSRRDDPVAGQSPSRSWT